jgi:hypothetical protein
MASARMTTIEQMPAMTNFMHRLSEFLSIAKVFNTCCLGYWIGFEPRRPSGSEKMHTNISK